MVDKDEDMANARIEFQSGCVANLFVSRVSRESVRRMQVWSPRAFAAIDFAALTTTLVRPSQSLLRGTFHVDELSPQQVEYYRQHFAADYLPCEQLKFEAVDALSLEVQDFVQSIHTSVNRGKRPVRARRRGLGRRDHQTDPYPLGRCQRHFWRQEAASPRDIIPVPHLPLAADSLPLQHREAG